MINRFRRRIAASAAMVLLMVGALQFAGTAPARADLYDDPGIAYSSNRYWMTWCETYSGPIRRCWNDTTSAGKWAFNTLTYVGGTKAQWGSNPLANTGTWTSSGRQWKTECNTPATGANGCRSYIWDGSKWVVNNIVRFGTKQPNLTWRPGASTGGSATYSAATKFNNATRMPTHASGLAGFPVYSGRSHTITLRSASLATQSDLDNCAKNPGRWQGNDHVAAHNHCNSWESDAWHDFRRGDRVTVKNVNGTTAYVGIIDRDFSIPYGSDTFPTGITYPASGQSNANFWIQASWRTNVFSNPSYNHIIVIKK